MKKTIIAVLLLAVVLSQQTQESREIANSILDFQKQIDQSQQLARENADMKPREEEKLRDLHRDEESEMESSEDYSESDNSDSESSESQEENRVVMKKGGHKKGGKGVTYAEKKGHKNEKKGDHHEGKHGKKGGKHHGKKGKHGKGPEERWGKHHGRRHHRLGRLIFLVVFVSIAIAVIVKCCKKCKKRRMRQMKKREQQRLQQQQQQQVFTGIPANFQNAQVLGNTTDAQGRPHVLYSVPVQQQAFVQQQTFPQQQVVQGQVPQQQMPVQNIQQVPQAAPLRQVWGPQTTRKSGNAQYQAVEMNDISQQGSQYPTLQE